MSRILPLIAVFVVLAGALASRPAHASCGDWLAHPDEDQAATQSTDDHSQPPSHRPCNGPLCKQSPGTPIPPAPAPPVERSQQPAAYLRNPLLVEAVWNCRAAALEAYRLPSGHHLAIERPPEC